MPARLLAAIVVFGLLGISAVHVRAGNAHEPTLAHRLATAAAKVAGPETSPTSGPRDGVYVSPTFGYVLHYATVDWFVLDETSQLGMDVVGLTNGPSLVVVAGYSDISDLNLCIQVVSTAFEFDPATTGFLPRASDTTATGVVSDFLLTNDEGEFGLRITCQSLPGGAALAIAHHAPEDQTETEAAALTQLLAGLVLPDA